MEPRNETAVRAAINDGLAALRRGEPGPLAAALRAHLHDDVMAFWERHGWEESTGSLITCLTDAGEIVSRDKWLWSQWRAVWVYSRLYRTIEPVPLWRERAERLAAFCLKNGWLENERGWALTLEGDGEVQRGHESTYTDAFAVYGLTELWRSTGDAEHAAAVRRSADAALEQLSAPRDTVPHFPYGLPAGIQPHGIPMIWSLILAEAGAALDDARYRTRGRALADETFVTFHRPASDLVVEFADLAGASLPPPRGTTVVPGHVIEDMWFQLHTLDATGDDPARRQDALRVMRRHLEFGWDETHGGLVLAKDAEGAAEVGWPLAELKLWWPQTEALYGALLGWAETGEAGWLDWYERLWALCLDHYVDWQHGEWRQKLGPDLQPWTGVVALPVKDPFHLPRSLILQIELLERCAANRPT